MANKSQKKIKKISQSEKEQLSKTLKTYTNLSEKEIKAVCDVATKNEFRYNYATKHMNYIFQERGNRYVGMGLTKNFETFGIKNMPLKENPQTSKKDTQAYIRNGIISDKKKYYSKQADKRFEFRNEEDIANVKSKKRNYKKVVKKTNKR